MRINYVHQTVSCAEKLVVAQNQVDMGLLSHNSTCNLWGKNIPTFPASDLSRADKHKSERISGSDWNHIWLI